MLAVITLSLLFQKSSGAGAGWKSQTFEGVTISAPVALAPVKGAKSPGASAAKWSRWDGTSGGATYSVVVAQLGPKGNVASVFADNFSNWAENGIEPYVEKDVVADGWPGTDTTCDLPKGRKFMSRCVVTEDRFVTLTCTYAGERPIPELARQFVASVHLPTKGMLKVAGAPLKRYPLGDSGLTALFPAPPEKDVSDDESMLAQGFRCEYGSRTFFVMCAMPALPDSGAYSEEDIDSIRDLVATEFLKSLEAKSTSQRTEQDLCQKSVVIDFKTKDDDWGTIRVFYYKGRFVAIGQYAEPLYVAPKTVDTFLRSVQPKG